MSQENNGNSEFWDWMKGLADRTFDLGEDWAETYIDNMGNNQKADTDAIDKAETDKMITMLVAGGFIIWIIGKKWNPN